MPHPSSFVPHITEAEKRTGKLLAEALIRAIATEREAYERAERATQDLLDDYIITGRAAANRTPASTLVICQRRNDQARYQFNTFCAAVAKRIALKAHAPIADYFRSIADDIEPIDLTTIDAGSAPRPSAAYIKDERRDREFDLRYIMQTRHCDYATAVEEYEQWLAIYREEKPE